MSMNCKCQPNARFVIPLDDADGLVYGIQAAARGHATEKPDWLLDVTGQVKTSHRRAG